MIMASKSSGKVAAIGGRMLEAATRMVINQFFKRLTARRWVAPNGAGIRR